MRYSGQLDESTRGDKAVGQSIAFGCMTHVRTQHACTCQERIATMFYISGAYTAFTGKPLGIRRRSRAAWPLAATGRRRIASLACFRRTSHDNRRGRSTPPAPHPAGKKLSFLTRGRYFAPEKARKQFLFRRRTFTKEPGLYGESPVVFGDRSGGRHRAPGQRFEATRFLGAESELVVAAGLFWERLGAP